ncbi:uncharacterized protein LOC131857213 isoform X1 [Cryptomeria japonica]|uniref:uncharacterized protein LOC131857213 isoform X1 n=1 Tax=Cryptomeria japonica TaxID=3369 RepID=UPI0027DA5567|nr:uncharacterized protein LOC131857213 isoform X1 [Cryptomeria japonica]
MLTLISGGPLQVGFVDTQGQAFIDILHPGDVTIFSRGTLHFELNVGTEETNYISALNSQNPGVVTSSMPILKLPLKSVATAFNITQQAVKKLDSTIYASDSHSPKINGVHWEPYAPTRHNVSRYPLPWAKTQEAEFSHCAFMAREKFQWMMYTDVGEFVLSDSWLNEQVGPEDKGFQEVKPKSKDLTSGALLNMVMSLSSPGTAFKNFRISYRATFLQV